MTYVSPFPHTERLLWVMEQLRDPDTGCPWDKQQTFETIVPFTIEEAYEVADAIENGTMEEVKDELGDLLFQVVFYAQMGQEQGEFDFEAIAEAVTEKLIRRHPHVFADVRVEDEEALNANWEQSKAQERKEKGYDQDTSILAHVPVGMAPLKRAHKLQKKCAKVGFDWAELPPVVDKIKEEIDEVMTEVAKPSREQQAVEEEIGDLLFAVVNLSRHLNVDADTALRKANVKFEQRFRALEQQIEQQGKSLTDSTLDEMEAVWQAVKSGVKG